MLGGFIKPTHIADFLKRQPSLVNHSTNPSFELGDGTVEVRRNLIVNPSFESGGKTGWTSNYNGDVTESFPSSGARFGSRTLRLTWTRGATSQSTGIYGGGGTGEVYIPVPSGGTYYASAYVKPSADMQYRINIQRQGSSLVVGAITLCPAGVWTRLSATATADSSTTGLRVNVYSVGTTQVLGDTIDIDGILLEQTGAALPYFDGSTNDGFDTASLTPAWTGTANDSASVLNGTGVVGGFRFNATIAPAMWLSSDSPNHGSKFMRVLMKHSSASVVSAADTSGVASGEERTYIGNYRANRGQTVQPRWSNSSGGGAGSEPVGGTFTLSTDWSELRRTGTSTHNNATLSSLMSDVQAGDIIDIDKHMVIKGDYKGGWFAGTFSFSDASRNTMENWRAWLRSQGAKGVKTYELENQWLRDQGYTGTFADMFYAKFGDRDAARSFFEGN